MTIIKETDDWCLVEWHPATKEFPARRSKLKKYLCVGGPFDKQLKSSAQLDDGDGYFGFNAAEKMSMDARKLPYWNKQKNSLIWVHDTLLK